MLTKRQVKAKYNRAEYGLTDAVADLMFDHGMDHGDAVNFLMTVPKTSSSEKVIA